MKHLALIVFLTLINIVGSAQTINVEGSRSIEIKPEASSGLNKIIVVENASAATLSYRPSSPQAQWQSFGSQGGASVHDITPVVQNGIQMVTAPSTAGGFVINDNARTFYLWVVNYAAYPYNITSVTPTSSDCDRLRLEINGSAPQMPLYSINGRPLELDRQIEVSFQTLGFDQDSFSYYTKETSENIKFTTSEALYVPAPKCPTQYVVHPDRFAAAWHLAGDVYTHTMPASAVAAQVRATQTETEADNLQKIETEGLGGSAPCEIAFEAIVSDAAIFHRWEISTLPDFADTELTFNDLSFTYTFTEAGNRYVRFIADNAEGTCPWESETFVINIGESRLECPNAFSPGASEGVNDIWKVSYRSIIEFDCHIFNRWGKELAHFTNPADGWDGIIGGKPAPSGVYFYVITARGSDGKQYKLCGDINIISSRTNPNRPATSE